MIWIWLTALCAPLLRRLAAPRPVAGARRVLVIQTAKIGDLICATPLLRALAAALPDARVDLLAQPFAAELLAREPSVHRCLPVTATAGWRAKIALVRRLRRERYDLVVGLNAAVVWPLATFWAGIPIRAGIVPSFSGRSYRAAMRYWSHREPHRGERLIQLTHRRLLAACGVPVADEPSPPPKVVVPAPDADRVVTARLGATRGRWVGVGVSSANKLKELGDAKLIELIGRLLDDPQLTVVLVGSAADGAQGARIRAALTTARPADGARVLDSCGLFSLSQLPALLGRLSAYVGVDSGITYMADALAVPLVSIAGPCNMRETGPYQSVHRIIQDPLPCCPCAHIFRAPASCALGTRACIVGIDMIRVEAAVREVWR